MKSSWWVILGGCAVVSTLLMATFVGCVLTIAKAALETDDRILDDPSWRYRHMSVMGQYEGFGGRLRVTVYDPDSGAFLDLSEAQYEGRRNTPAWRY